MKKLSQKGQTAIEYLLMLAVVSGLCITFTKKAQEYLLTNPNSHINKYLNAYKKILQQDPRYKSFTIPR
jgi:hypothetical protein